MTVLLYFAIFYTFILLLFLLGLLLNKKKRPAYHKRLISVIIACKNEEQNVKDLIASLTKQTYPIDKYEVILADDNSTDSTAKLIQTAIANHPNFHYIHVSPSEYPSIVGKKKPITAAVTASKGEILAFTDADCLPAPEWLDDINNAFATKIGFYAGFSPLKYKRNNLFTSLKSLERVSIFAVSAGSFGLNIPLTCTARNMAYTRELWQEVHGFSGIKHLRSGDDDLMLHKIRCNVGRYYFSFNCKAIVTTKQTNRLKTQLSAETRRASKFFYYPFYIKLLVLFVLTFYAILCYRGYIAITTRTLEKDLLLVLTAKLAFEFTLLGVFLLRFRRLVNPFTFIIAEILYIPYFVIFGIIGTFGRYKWKK